MFEPLESRLLLSVLAKGTLKITGTNRADTINVSQRKANDISSGGIGNDSMTGEGGNDIVHGDDGNDWLSAGNECQWGTEHQIHTCFVIPADSDDDQLFGDAGSDHLFASKGIDTVNGGDG